MPIRVVAGEAKGRRLKTPKTTGTRPIIDRVKTALFDILSVRVEDAAFLDLFAGTGSVGIEALSRGAASATFIELNASALKLVRENLQITGLASRAETLQMDAFKFLQAYAIDTEGKTGGVTWHLQGSPPSAQLPPATTLKGTTPLSEDGAMSIGGRARRHVVARGEAGIGAALAGATRVAGPKHYDIIYVAPPQYKGMAARALALLDDSLLVPETGLVIVQIHPRERSEIVAVSLTHLALTDERRYGSTLLMFYERM